MAKLSDNKLYTLQHNVKSNEDYWYITKQECDFCNLCYIGEILSRWDADGHENYQDFFNRIKITPEFEKYVGSTAHRATINLTPYGLRKDEKGYNPSDLTDVFFKIKKITQGNYNDTSLYQSIIDEQVERINLVTSHISISPMMFTFKVLLTIGDVTGDYSVSKDEFKTFISTATKWNEFFEVVDSILRYRSDSQYRSEVGSSEGRKIANDTRYNLVIDNHSMISVEGNQISIPQQFVDDVRMKVAKYELLKPVDIEDVPLSSTESIRDVSSAHQYEDNANYLRAMRTKPFLLLAGISGTGKSRIVKQMAFDSCPNDARLREDATTPGNYCLVEVKPNWHDSSELMGYESQIGKPHYVVTPFVRFLAKAMLYEEQRVPFFVCLDEMNLAPVEQYFAEFLSVLESRKVIDGKITSEPLIPKEIFAHAKYERQLKEDLFGLQVKKVGEEDGKKFFDGELADEELKAYSRLTKDGMRIPSNLIVIGTVNMDETTHQFSRKVIDRAMTIEMNLPEGEPFLDFFNNDRDMEYSQAPISADLFLPSIVKAADAVKALSDSQQGGNAEKTEWLKNEVASILTGLNTALEGTPFKIAYRVQNELMLYFYELWQDNKEAEWNDILKESVDQILVMKVLPRIEGDVDLLKDPLTNLASFCAPYRKATVKVAEMTNRLERAHFTSYWP